MERRPVPLIRNWKSSRQPVPATLQVDPAFGDPDAALLRDAMERADWDTVQRIITAAADPDDEAFLVDVAAAVEGCEQWLPDVVRDNLDSTLPLLVYGARAVAWAWEARSRAAAGYVSEEQFALFLERLRLADDCLQSVVRRDPGRAAAWQQLITVARGQQLDLDEATRRFERAVTHHPGQVRAHQQLLQNLCRKWSGSHEKMHRFARESMLNAPPGSPLGHLVALAHLEQWLDQGGDTGYIMSLGVCRSLHEAADKSIRHPAYQKKPGWPYVHNVFAMAFDLAGERAAAAEQFELIGDLVTQFPWAYRYTDPGLGYSQRRAAVLSAGRRERGHLLHWLAARMYAER
jgi:tetratricopeptide (TPR) repeat protein